VRLLKISVARIAPLALFSTLLILIALLPNRVWAQTPPVETSLRGQIIDENGQPVPRVQVLFRIRAGESRTLYSAATGRFVQQSFNTYQVLISVS
jgi:hypothetical protein